MNDENTVVVEDTNTAIVEQEYVDVEPAPKQTVKQRKHKNRVRIQKKSRLTNRPSKK